MSPDVSLKTTTRPSISAGFFFFFPVISFHVLYIFESGLRRQHALKEGQLQMAENSKHDNNLSCQTKLQPRQAV